MRVFIPLLMVLILAARRPPPREAYKQVWVTQSDSGEVLRGRMLRLSGETLALLTPDNRRVEVPLDHVLRIEVHGDSLKNGATIGAIVMGGLTGIGCAAVQRASQCATALASIQPLAV